MDRSWVELPSGIVHSTWKRYVAFALAAAIVFTNAGVGINTAYAFSSSETITFSVSGSQLAAAVNDAIVNGNVVTQEDMSFTNGKTEEFETLFFHGEGRLYEVFPELEGGSMDAELRVFVRVPEDSDDMYMVTGDEELLFLYINNSEDTISCTTEITRMDNGQEKVKKTSKVTIKSYEEAFGDEEVNLTSKPEDKPPVATGSEAGTAGPAEEETTKASEETTAPSEEGTTEAPEEEITAPSEESTTEAPEEITVPSEESTTEAPEEITVPSEESTSEAPEEETTEAPEEIAETEADEPDSSRAETAEPVASIIPFHVPRVAVKEEVSEDSKQEEETSEEPEQETEAVESMTEAADPTLEAAESTAQAVIETAEHTGAESESSGSEDSKPVEESTRENETTSAEDESPTHVPEESMTVQHTATPSDADMTSGTQEEEKTISKAGTNALVGMGYCSTAKVYMTTLNKLKALNDFEGYKISYSVFPEASARIVEGPRGIAEGESLSFGVENRLGHLIESVKANGEELQADSVVDNDNGSQTAWYFVQEILEEQEIEILTKENDQRPEFREELFMEDGTVITFYAPEGVLPPYVKAEADVVTGIEDTIKKEVERPGKDGEGTKEVIASLSYNISLLDADGNKLDHQALEGAVQVTFSGFTIAENSGEADQAEILYAKTSDEGGIQTDATVSDFISLESASEPVEIAEGQGIESVSFDAEHFSLYTVVFSKVDRLREVGLDVHIMDAASREELGKIEDTVYLTASEGDEFAVADILNEIQKEKSYDALLDPDQGLIRDKILDIVTSGDEYNADNQVDTLYYHAGDESEGGMYSVRLEDGQGGYVYKNEVFSLYLWYMGKGITFDPNGIGDGESRTFLLTDGVYTMPSLEDLGITADPGKTFVGWSVVQDGSGSNYISNVQIKDISPNSTFYAIWLDDDAQGDNTAYFFVRSDNEIRYEPAYYSDKEYYPGSGSETDGNKGSIKENKAVNNNLDAVRQNIASEPDYDYWEEQIKGFDAGRQTIEWYVIKKQGVEGNIWHVDGVIQGKNGYSVMYDTNGGSTDCPGSIQYVEGETVEVMFDPVPVRQGYAFAGWDMDPAAVTPAYPPEQGSSFVMPAENVTLYAIWTPVNELGITVKYVEAGSWDSQQKRYTNVLAVDGTSLAKGKQGEFYTVPERSFSDYDYAKGTLAESTIDPNRGQYADSGETVYVLYARKNSLNITVRYVEKESWDEASGEYANMLAVDDTSLTGGTAGAVYEIPERSFDGYRYSRETFEKSVEDPNGGRYTEMLNAVYVLYSRKEAEAPGITVKYVEKESWDNTQGRYMNVLEEDRTSLQEGIVGDSFMVPERIFAGYRYANGTFKESTVDPNRGIYADPAETVYVLYSKRNDLSVTVRYVVKASFDETGNRYRDVLAVDDTSLTGGTIGAAYTVPGKSIAGYCYAGNTFEDSIVDPEDGRYSDPGGTVYVLYRENTDIPISYVSEGGGKGFVSRTEEYVAPAKGAPEGAVANPADGYVFTHWTDSHGRTVGTGSVFKPSRDSKTGIFKAEIYTAHFAASGDLSYRVEYYYDGKLGGDADVREQVALNTNIPYIAQPREYNGSNYIFERIQGSRTVGNDSSENVLKVFYTLDAVGTVIPNKPDGVPDKYLSSTVILPESVPLVWFPQNPLKSNSN